jgi:hypothetical protein
MTEKGTVPAAVPADARQRFEDWSKLQPGDDMDLKGAQWGVNFLYFDPHTQAAWVGFQGALWFGETPPPTPRSRLE